MMMTTVIGNVWAYPDDVNAQSFYPEPNLPVQDRFHQTLNALNIDINSRDGLAPFDGDAFSLNLVNAVELPYVSPRFLEYEYPEELSMRVILPHTGEFEAMESSLDPSS